MELEGFWVFITIIIVSVVFIFLMTRDDPSITVDENKTENKDE